ncbi:hypothetical protein MBLNU230_g8168t1 [Neophaeotheca triangularis]
MAKVNEKRGNASPTETPVASLELEQGINASGHQQELQRNFGFFAIVGLALTSGNTWLAFGGSIAIAIYNGGSPGVIWEFVVVSVLYWFVAASIAELASAMPSAGGVYHWATVTGGKRHGRWIGFFAGWWNCLAWNFGLASCLQIAANQLTSMYAVTHPDYEIEHWHIFLTYILLTVILGSITLFANSALPRIEQAGLFFLLAGVFISIIVCAIMPGTTGNGYATSSSVWTEWVNLTGYSSDGLVFLAGMLNGAFAVGTPDITSHMAEEIPNPSRNLPRAILLQYVAGFITAFTYSIAILYAITDFDAVFDQPYPFTLTEIYVQATGSTAGATGLLVVVFIPSFIATAGVWLTASRTLWTLARDDATPCSSWLGKVNQRTKNPFNAVLACGGFSVVLGCIYMGSEAAFMAFIGSFAVLGFLSYISAILPHLLSGRKSVVPGHWSMGKYGTAVNIVACLFIATFTVIFCFPFALPIDPAETMNWTSVLVGGCTIFMAITWMFKRKGYQGPKYIPITAAALEKDAV